MLSLFTALSLSLTLTTALSPPACQNTAPPQNLLFTAKTTTLNLPARPFGMTYLPSSNHAFVALSAGNTSSIALLDTSHLQPKLLHEIPLPAKYTNFQGVGGIALTEDKRYLLVTALLDTLVLDVPRILLGEKENVLLGVLNNTLPNTQSAIEVSTLEDYAFVSQEYGHPAGSIAAYKLPPFHPQEGQIPIIQPQSSISLGRSVVGSALSKNRQNLYVTSEGLLNSTQSGSLSVLSVPTLKHNPSEALLGSIDAGCQPVRVAVHPDGRTVWVTARGSNSVLAFSTEKILSRPEEALLAEVQVGLQPVGLAFFDGGRRLLTADSSRFDTSKGTTGLTVVDTEKARALGRIATGTAASFPREIAISPDGRRALVSLFGNQGTNEKPVYQIEAVDLTSLP